MRLVAPSVVLAVLLRDAQLEWSPTSDFVRSSCSCAFCATSEYPDSSSSESSESSNNLSSGSDGETGSMLRKICIEQAV